MNTKLTTLVLKRNDIGINGISDLEALLDYKSVISLDLSYNKIDNPLVLEQIFVKMPNL